MSRLVGLFWIAVVLNVTLTVYCAFQGIVLPVPWSSLGTAALWAFVVIRVGGLTQVWRGAFTACAVLMLISGDKSSLTLWLLGGGFLLNALAVDANGGQMPVDTRHVGPEYFSGMHQKITERTRLRLLCDIIPSRRILRPHDITSCVSIGDICMGLAIYTEVVIRTWILTTR